MLTWLGFSAQTESAAPAVSFRRTGQIVFRLMEKDGMGYVTSEGDNLT